MSEISEWYCVMIPVEGDPEWINQKNKRKGRSRKKK